MAKFDRKLILIAVVTTTLGLVLSTSTNRAVAQEPDVRFGNKPAVSPGLPAGDVEAALAKAISLAEELTLSTNTPPRSSDVKVWEESVASPRIPTDGKDVTAVMVARDQPELPCPTSCVQGANWPAIGLAFPQSLIHAGDTVEYTVLGVNGTYEGPCTRAFVALRLADNQVIDADAFQTTCSPSSVFYSSWGGRTMPNLPGEAILLGFLIAADGTRDYNFSLFSVQ